MSSSEDGLFAKSEPQVAAAYRALLAALERLGPFQTEPKKTSIHLVAGSAFAGVHPQKAKLRLNVRSDHAIASDRVRKTEQVSARRFHNEIDLAGPSDVDAELMEWLAAAYALGQPAPVRA